MYFTIGLWNKVLQNCNGCYNGEIDRKEKLFKLCDIIFEDSHFAIDATINKIHQNINATNDALNGVETVTKSDENTPGTCFSYNLLQIKPLQK